MRRPLCEPSDRQDVRRVVFGRFDESFQPSKPGVERELGIVRSAKGSNLIALLIRRRFEMLPSRFEPIGHLRCDDLEEFLAIGHADSIELTTRLPYCVELYLALFVTPITENPLAIFIKIEQCESDSTSAS